METANALEIRRLALQEDLDSRKSRKERNRLGQFATPPELASEILAYARKIFPSKASVRFLDPSFGTGSFYSALLGHFSRTPIGKALGIELDPHYAIPARGLWSHHSLEIELGDFTKLRPPHESDRFNLIICNPPYVRHHHLNAAEKVRLRAASHAACGVRMAGLAGLYCHFLCIAHAWMAEDGIAGWLIPSEFMDVNYGMPVKRYLLNEVELLRIHRFESGDLQFGDALVSSSIVWFRKNRPERAHHVELSYGGTLLQPKVSRLVAAQALQGARKLSTFMAGEKKQEAEGPRLSDFFWIKRGLATGDNRFFILPRAEIEARRLPWQFFRPILPGPRYLSSNVIEADPDGAPIVEGQKFILDCRLPENVIRERYPQLWSYLETGKPKVSGTYLCSRRNPWYAQENRPPAPFVCTYMGRNAGKRENPFRFLLNRSQATAANVYLLLYPVPKLAAALNEDPLLARGIWEILDSIPVAALLGEGRVYGGGLYKLEPKELANVRADAIAALLPKTAALPPKQSEMFRESAV
jgi:predicted RNA methylase